MDTSIKILLCDFFIMWTVYLVSNGVNKYTAATQNEEGRLSITNRHIAILRTSVYNVYLLAWPAHVLVRELLTWTWSLLQSSLASAQPSASLSPCSVAHA